jgi:hypothetical protein
VSRVCASRITVATRCNSDWDYKRSMILDVAKALLGKRLGREV